MGILRTWTMAALTVVLTTAVVFVVLMISVFGNIQGHGIGEQIVMAYISLIITWFIIAGITI